ncbi:MAG TPA: winged helix-turn-helix domain-containing protein [Anaerohalosphaeraceae bacterium]|nr:winged helix-turn-helix domain-containing protein [Anaerohalosphaeraceae bacterium]HRS71454.1 winged helix-turn-helix domain-containing protein [Anaerohalosphaeraceae bacterium]
MKDTDVQIGTCYDIKVGNNTTAVRITKPLPTGGWEAVTLSSKKTLTIKSAKRIVGPHNPKGGPQLPTTAHGATKGNKPGQDTIQRPSKNPAEPVQNTLRTKKTSLLDAAAQVLAESKEPLNCKQMIETMMAKDYWKPSHAGKTPANTLHAAIGAEIKKKGSDAHFQKVGRGQFALNGIA